MDTLTLDGKPRSAKSIVVGIDLVRDCGHLDGRGQSLDLSDHCPREGCQHGLNQRMFARARKPSVTGFTPRIAIANTGAPAWTAPPRAACG